MIHRIYGLGLGETIEVDDDDCCNMSPPCGGCGSCSLFQVPPGTTVVQLLPDGSEGNRWTTNASERAVR